MTAAALVWNRALNRKVQHLFSGDRALAALHKAHGCTMNGGVLHAVECLSALELADAESGYRFFGLSGVANLFTRAREAWKAQQDLELFELESWREYRDLIPSDSALFERFEAAYKNKPSDFAPL